MTKNPFINSLVASLYISLIASLLFYGPKKVGLESSIIMPIIMISLFTLSAAVMGYLFLYQPIQLYFDGQKKQAINFFLKTVAFFAAVTFIIAVLSFWMY